MRYLAFFRPEGELADRILRQEGLALPSSGLHATVCAFRMGREHEASLVRGLSAIAFPAFDVETTGYAVYDEGSTVLELSLPPALELLHHAVAGVAERYGRLGTRGHGEHVKEAYSPHVTLAKREPGFGRAPELVGVEERVTEYHLARRDEDGWRRIRRFGSIGYE